MDTGDLTLFHCDDWLSAKLEGKTLVKDVVATIRGKAQLKCESEILNNLSCVSIHCDVTFSCVLIHFDVTANCLQPPLTKSM